jgi:hypothetical protein
MIPIKTIIEIKFIITETVPHQWHRFEATGIQQQNYRSWRVQRAYLDPLGSDPHEVNHY